jgi:hypothetical protein
MSDIATSRKKFIAALDSKIEGSAGDIFDEGLKMAEAGKSNADITSYLSSALKAKDGGEFKTKSDCAAECASQCSDYPSGAPWYACYAGCYAGCSSA